MLRVTLTASLLAALVFTFSALASAPPVGPLPKGPVTSISTSKGSLVSVALQSRTGKSWRLARAVNAHVLVEVSEANVGNAVVIVYRAVGTGSVSVRYGLTRGEQSKAYAAATFNVRVR
jgi:hypothetical protein